MAQPLVHFLSPLIVYLFVTHGCRWVVLCHSKRIYHAQRASFPSRSWSLFPPQPCSLFSTYLLSYLVLGLSCQVLGKKLFCSVMRNECLHMCRQQTRGKLSMLSTGDLLADTVTAEKEKARKKGNERVGGRELFFFIDIFYVSSFLQKYTSSS